jgi:protein CLEC16A
MFAGGSSKEKVAPTSTPESRFSLPFLKKLHQELLESKNVDDNNESQVIEILRLLAEMVVYGDNKSEMLFDFFCEKNMLSLFLEIMWCPGGCPLAVHFQILQTLSILVNSVKNDTSLYYLLSNNYVNEIIVFPHDFSEDESLRDQFVSFMKSLSLRLNKQTVQFFFIEETGSFPLLMKAIELIVYNEPMVRIASGAMLCKMIFLASL